MKREMSVVNVVKLYVHLQYLNALFEHPHTRCLAVLAAGCCNDQCQYDIIVLAGVQCVLTG